MRHVLIMAGGSGKRLWPLSRQDMPKQLLKVLGGKSLLRIAFERLDGVVPPEQVLVCTGADYAHVVAAELPEVLAENILGEPEGRDSLNAVAWPAAVLAARDPEAVVAVVTADQIMHPVESFRAALEEGFAVAEEDPLALVTFGVVPTSPHTGYGYLRHTDALPGRPEVRDVAEFKEKPDLATAEAYLASGSYWWNAGMFVWRASTLLEQLALLHPDTHAQVVALAAEPDRLAEIYPRLLKISVDYAVMEPASQGRGSGHVVAVRLPITWHDVGGFASLSEQLPRDAHGNATQGVSVLVDARDNVVINHAEDGRLVAVVGLSDTVIVQTPQITLVCPVDQAERIKELVAEVTGRLGREYA
ncbi:mannose-1-phosphate guanylyltransferase (GDP) [Friedmanniella luteola]|uniref:Mannose-1-phosphate guanylyltransferase (GDP) n=1 Tax=Friedmanniella luteola TaxID=546871 RepID=A0A1H1YHP9_9ACTN|nr:mannose-1-phosphate guanylyltransferase [Friedmanniella luteola]SDT20546.1 mannose-1-phosphate guanylyltransferase (GDP) [Friedmanniella luteola]